MDPKNPSASSTKAYAISNLGMNEEALNASEKAIEFAPKYIFARTSQDTRIDGYPLNVSSEREVDLVTVRGLDPRIRPYVEKDVIWTD